LIDISSLEEANEYLHSTFLPKYNQKFIRKAKVEVHRCLDGPIHIFYKGEELPFKPIVPVEDEQIRSFSNGSFAGRGMTFLFCRKYDIIILHSDPRPEILTVLPLIVG